MNTEFGWNACRTMHSWEDNNKMDPTEVEWKGVDWIDKPKEGSEVAFVNVIIGVLVPQKEGTCLISQLTVRFWRRLLRR
jgi:hypothetical protein